MKRVEHPFVAAFALFEAIVIAFVVLRVLPARVAAVDAPLLSVAIALAASAVSLAAGFRFATKLALVVLAVTLLAGLAVLTALVLAVAEVSGTYGSIGEGIGLLFALATLVVVPYLVALPAAQIYFLLRARTVDAPIRAA